MLFNECWTRKREMPTMNEAFSFIKQCWFIMVMLGLWCVCVCGGGWQIRERERESF